MAGEAAKPAPPPGRVSISSKDPPLEVRCYLSDERPNVESGFGGWQEVARPRRKPLTSWTGLPACRMTLPLLLDGWADGNSVEDELADLGTMALPNAKDGRPSRVTIRTTGAAIPFQDLVWVIEDVTFGDALMNEAGNRTRQQVTLHLLEFMDDVSVTAKSAAVRRIGKAKADKPKQGAQNKRTASKGKAKPRASATSRALTTAAFDGEDLLRLAARELGDATRWPEIAALNGIRDPRAIRRGQVLRLP